MIQYKVLIEMYLWTQKEINLILIKQILNKSEQRILMKFVTKDKRNYMIALFLTKLDPYIRFDG